MGWCFCQEVGESIEYMSQLGSGTMLDFQQKPKNLDLKRKIFLFQLYQYTLKKSMQIKHFCWPQLTLDYEFILFTLNSIQISSSFQNKDSVYVSLTSEISVTPVRSLVNVY